MAKIVRSFPPVLPENPKILILGSMPGVKSLEAGQYYAHPKNVFWDIMGEVLCFPARESSYGERIAALERNSVALWDMLELCERSGSLDSKIKSSSEKPNNVGALLAGSPSVRAVIFNGVKAERVFSLHTAPFLKNGVSKRLHLEKLPSTSPANARITRELKTALWRRAITKWLL